jgi:hypothetical protein
MKSKWIKIALVGLLMSVGLVMGAANYGYSKVAGYTPARASTGTITSEDGQLFYWGVNQRHVVITNSPDSPANIWVNLNRTTCNPSSSDFVFILEPGETWSGYANASLVISQIAIYADSPVTVGTDICIVGVN